jgi:hypothetical protein
MQGIDRPMTTRRLVAALAVAAMALAAPAAADAAKYRGKANGQKITFNQKGKRISKVVTTVYVTCFASDGSDTEYGFELFDPPGKFRLGRKGKKSARRESAVRGGEQDFNFEMTPRRKSRRKIRGKLRLSYTESTYDPFSNSTTLWVCSGSAKFVATKRR